MRVSKWGNGLAIRLPKAPVEEPGLKPGDRLEIVSGRNGRIVIAKDERRLHAVKRMRARAWSMPDGNGFDREEANAW